MINPMIHDEDSNTGNNFNLKLWWLTFSRNFDWPIFVMMISLIVFGLVMVFSATMFLPIEGGAPQPIDSVFKQMAAAMMGLILGIIAFIVPYKHYKNPFLLLVGMGVILVLLIYTHFFGQEANGAKSWIYLFGFSFQSSELIKIFAVLSLSWLIEYTGREFRWSREEFTDTPIPWLLIFSLLLNLFLIFLQPDLGMLLIIILTLVFLWIIHRERKLRNLLFYFALLIILTVTYLFSNHFSESLITSTSHTLQRLGIYVNPFADPTDIGYQLVNGYIAISKGGWFGQGIGDGSMKYGQIPAIHNDFIIANIAEELGFVGVFILFLLFVFLYIRIFRWSVRVEDSFRAKVISGLGLVLAIQTTINLGGVLGIIPLTGVTLPFISSGGSSMIISIICIFVILKMIFHDKLEVYLEKEGEKIASY